MYSSVRKDIGYSDGKNSYAVNLEHGKSRTTFDVVLGGALEKPTRVSREDRLQSCYGMQPGQAGNLDLVNLQCVSVRDITPCRLTFSPYEQACVAVGGCFCRDVCNGISVYLNHPTELPLPIALRILNNTKGVDPEVAHTELPDNNSSFLESTQ